MNIVGKNVTKRKNVVKEASYSFNNAFARKISNLKFSSKVKIFVSFERTANNTLVLSIKIKDYNVDAEVWKAEVLDCDLETEFSIVKRIAYNMEKQGFYVLNFCKADIYLNDKYKITAVLL